MGVKNLKEHFNIKHIVHRVGDKICIGLANCSALITIDKDFEVTCSRVVGGSGVWTDIYEALVEHSKSGKDTGISDLQRLIESDDQFTRGFMYSVWYERRGRIYKSFCEEEGWPNTTITGELMYENTHFKTRKACLAYHVKGSRREFFRMLRDYIRDFKTDVVRQWRKFGYLLEYVRILVFRGY